MTAMLAELAALEPSEAVLPIIALIGLVPVAAQYREQSKWFVVGYLLLVVATVSTNLEALFLGTALNVVEHSVGLMGSGIAFLVAGYLRRNHVLASRSGVDPEADAEAGA